MKRKLIIPIVLCLFAGLTLFNIGLANRPASTDTTLDLISVMVKAFDEGEGGFEIGVDACVRIWYYPAGYVNGSMGDYCFNEDYSETCGREEICVKVWNNPGGDCQAVYCHRPWGPQS